MRLASFHQQASFLLLIFHADEEAGLSSETAVQRAQVAEAAAAAGYDCAAATVALAAAAAAVEEQVSSTIQKHQYKCMRIAAYKKKMTNGKEGIFLPQL